MTIAYWMASMARDINRIIVICFNASTVAALGSNGFHVVDTEANPTITPKCTALQMRS